MAFLEHLLARPTMTRDSKCMAIIWSGRRLNMRWLSFLRLAVSPSTMTSDYDKLP
jgi:hypothetical protein